MQAAGNLGPPESPCPERGRDVLPVTVILTVFERTAFLREAIVSVMGQSAQPGEIVVCDDSASPAIREICASFGAGLEYRPNPKPLGVAVSVREAILAANQPLIAILNDDDSWEPGFLRTLVPPLLGHTDCVLSFADHWIMDETGSLDPAATDRNTRRYGRHRLTTGLLGDTAESVLRRNAVPLAMAAVFRREGVDWSLLTPAAGGAYDFWISCLLSATGRSFTYSSARVSRYRIHDKMETARRHPSRNEPMVRILENLVRLDWFPAQRRLLKRQLAMAWRAWGRDQLRSGRKADARRSFLRSMKIRPTVKSALGWLLSFLPV